MKKSIKVVGAIIKNENDEILCALRSPRMSRPNLWEFPGGKVEKDEIIKEAVVREIMEELGCNVEFKKVFSDTTHEYEDVIVNLITVECRLISGSLVATEHSKVIWLKRESLNSLIWAPADMDAVKKLIKG
ncbi:MAG: (deoxy)nucleoside triphosphate pyrophosphohydrolase [Clostridiaceae bacterium]